MIDILYFAEFLSLYYVKSKSVESGNDYQPVILDDDLIEIKYSESNFLKAIPLMLSKDKLACRKVKAVLRYHEPSAHESVE